MSASTLPAIIDVAELVDRYVDQYDDGEYTYPSLLTFDHDGAEWLTDRFWLLPRTVLAGLDKRFSVRPLPTDRAERARGWVRSILTADLLPTGRRFSAYFAGVLTLAGIRAWEIGDMSQVQVLVHEATGERVGGLMPVRSDTPKPRGTMTLPVSDDCRDMYERINAAGVVRQWQCWELAAHLTWDKS